MLNEEQNALLDWYETLNNAERCAVDAWLLTGDARSLLILRECSERLKRYAYMPFFKRPKEPRLHRGERAS